METLKLQWSALATKYSNDINLINQCFEAICNAYTESHRHYHNLGHISTMLSEINNSSDNSLDKDSLLFATWFHDIVYNPRGNDNEAQSAIVAINNLTQLAVPREKIELVEKLIIATANHTKAPANDDNLNFFLDCDLKVLSFNKEDYLQYAKNIREEYKHVIGFLYKNGRKKILKKFLESSSIYRTDYFKNNYEEQARKNISFELQIL